MSEDKRVLKTCSKCGEPTEVIRGYNGVEFISRVRCRCMREQAQQIEQEKLQRERQRRKELDWRGSSLVNADFKKASKNSIVKKAMKYCERYEEMKGKGLLFSGGVGTGKTFISACIINKLVDEGKVKNFIAISLPEAMANLEKSTEILEDLKKADIVLLDDFGTERNTSYAEELVYLIIDTCYKRKNPTIITTNKSVESFNNPANIHLERVFSRLWSMCIPLNLNGADKRLEALKSDIKYYKEILEDES